MPAVEFRVEHPVRDGLGGVGREVVGVHGRGGPAPPPDRVLEVPDQLRLLRVHTDDGIPVSAEQRLGSLNKAILLVTMWVRFASEAFDVRPQGIIHPLEQTSDRL